MLYSLIITLREGLEASLIIGIIAAYLVQTGHRQRLRSVWLGATVAILLSVGSGLGIYFSVGSLGKVAMEVIEGTAMFIAVGVLTYMWVWMRGQAANIKQQLQARVDSALNSGSGLALVALAFVVVVREGVETVLFLLGGAFSTQSPVVYLAGAIAGLGLAAFFGYSIYSGGRRLNLRLFFNVTSTVIIFLAAGLLANGFRAFHEILLIPPVVPHIWDTYGLLSDTSPGGRLLSAILGYDSSPSLVQAVAFFGYMVAGLWLYFGQQLHFHVAGRGAIRHEVN